MFFFKQKTAYEMRISDWSSDVCSSDLPVEEGGDRRQFVLETIAVAERQSCRRLESPERTALDLAAVEQTVKLAQGVARIPGFQIVLRSEPALAAGLALAAGARAQRVGTARDGGDDALLDRKSVVWGQRVTVRVERGGSRIKKKNKNT